MIYLLRLWAWIFKDIDAIEALQLLLLYYHSAVAKLAPVILPKRLYLPTIFLPYIEW